MYAQRGLEDTGRIGVWPRAIVRIIEAPLIGVGASNLATPATIRRLCSDAAQLPSSSSRLHPASFPLLLFVGYWVRLVVDTARLNAARHEDAPFETCLLLYSFLIVMNLNEPFMLPWVMITLAFS